MSTAHFRDRGDAAHALATALARRAGDAPVVLAIPRGAVPMGRIIADELGGELDLVLVRKLGAPGNPELAIGAVDETGRVVLNDDAVRVGANAAYVRLEAARQAAALAERRVTRARGRPCVGPRGRVASVGDDGLATGATMAAALRVVRARGPRRLLCAIPVASVEGLRRVGDVADEVVCLAAPRPFTCVSAHYDVFAPVSDAEVLQALDGRADHRSPMRSVRIGAGHVELPGELVVPDAPRGLVVFVHGSGSSRVSPRNRQVARVLNRAGFATLLFDLLTEAEDLRREARFDIPRLALRLEQALDWVHAQPALASLPLGLFGASTGSAVALMAAASGRHDVAAVVSRGGRPDLAGDAMLERVHAPTLLLVGSEDVDVLALNNAASRSLAGPVRLDLITGATHLFEEPGTRAEAAAHAAAWFVEHLAGGDAMRAPRVAPTAADHPAPRH